MSPRFSSLRPLERPSFIAVVRRPDTSAVRTRVARVLEPSSAPAEDADRPAPLRVLEDAVRQNLSAALQHPSAPERDARGEALEAIRDAYTAWQEACRTPVRAGINLPAQHAHMALTSAVIAALAVLPEDEIAETVTPLLGSEHAWGQLLSLARMRMPEVAPVA